MSKGPTVKESLVNWTIFMLVVFVVLYSLSPNNYFTNRDLYKKAREIAECAISGEKLPDDKIEEHIKNCMTVKGYYFSFSINPKLCLYDSPFAYKIPDCYLD